MKVMEARRSIRKYENRPVEKETLMQLLKAARLAPSGHNTQPWTFIIVESPETRQKLAEADHNQTWLLSAPILLVCVADIRARISESTELFLDENSPQEALKQIIRDSAIAIDHLLLEAEYQGLGACWTAYFVQDDVRPILNIPEDKYVCGIISIGYAAESPKARPRKSLEDMIMYEHWSR